MNRKLRTATGVAWLSCLCTLAAPAQNLLFKSGFENNTILGPTPGNGPNGFFQSITGTDTSTSFTWPLSAYSPAQTGIHLDPQSGNTDPYTSHFFNSIDTLTGHTGASTKALHLLISGYGDDTCCAQETLEGNTFATPIHSEYFRVWMKLPPAFLTAYQTFGDEFRMMWEWKTANNARLATEVWNKGGVPTWEIQWDDRGRNADSGGPGSCNYLDPNTGQPVHTTGSACPFIFYDGYNSQVAVPINQWFLFEVYMKRSTGNDGRIFWAINGNTLFDHYGPNYGYLNEEIDNSYFINVYSPHFPMEEWIDDLEIWDAPPCATLPCGASETGVISPTPAVPSVTSPFGATGVVGTPFSYQLKTDGSAATSYSASGLPAGLSLNKTTGLISGNPTAPGRSIVSVKATGNSGWSDTNLIFQINSVSSGLPTISSFSAAPSTVNAGGSSTLPWATGTATSLSIDQGVGDVTGRTSISVSPATTTTYTLTAYNANGHTTATAKVTVQQQRTVPTISS